MLLQYLAKKKGGRLQHVATFLNACKSTGDAEWVMNNTIQSYDEAAEEEFSYVGLTSILETQCIVKLMKRKGRMAAQEVAVMKWFSAHPHINIIQGICYFTCKDSPIRWKSRITQPQAFCNGTSSSTSFLVIIQEYIIAGDLSNVSEWTASLWKSVVLQLTYACMEWWAQGFVFGDWHFGNILLDTTQSNSHSYTAFGKTFKVRTHGVSPVLTDFARSTLQPPGSLDLWMLADQIATIWDKFESSCPFKTNEDDRFADFALQIGIVQNTTDFIAIVSRFRRALRRPESKHV